MNLFQISNDVLTSLIITVGSLIFTVFLIVVYYSKEKMNDIRCKFYRLMLAVVTFILLSEVLNIFFDIYNISGSIGKILYIAHWTSIIVWFVLFYCHSICYFGDIEAASIGSFFKQNKKSHLMIGFTLIALIGYFLIPSSNIEEISTTYLSGMAEYYVLLILVIISAWILFEGFIIIKNVPMRRKVSTILIMFVFLVVILLQIKFPTICLYSIVTSLQIFFIYFTIENPDIHMKNEIEKLKVDIDKSNSAKTDFLSNMSHEIRTPMNAIVGFSEALLNSQNFDSKKARMDIQNISVAGNNLLDIINNILDISKIESGKETLDEHEYDFGAIVAELSNIIRSRIDDSQVKFFVELEGDTPSKLYGDSTKVYQVLLNILSNSVKYTEVGKIKLTITPEYVDDEGQMAIIHFKVADTGYGIKPEDYDKLFSKFSRLEKAVSNEIEGTGLGLVITKRYVDLMDGKIWFESEYEVGTTFYVDIPQKVVDKTQIANIEKTTEQKNKNEYVDCSRFNALIVDDNVLNIKVAERILKKYGFNVDSATNGKDCVYKIKSGSNYDIIFMDHMMPEMDGIETLHIIKKLDSYDIPPIVALTANAITGMKEMYLREGFDSYLSKPINISELDKVIHQYLDKMTLSSISRGGVFQKGELKNESKGVEENSEQLIKPIDKEKTMEEPLLQLDENLSTEVKEEEVIPPLLVVDDEKHEEIKLETTNNLDNINNEESTSEEKTAVVVDNEVEPLVKITDLNLLKILDEVDKIGNNEVEPMSEVINSELLKLLDEIDIDNEERK